MEIRGTERRQALTAFTVYLRTGRRIASGPVEMKYNLWHDEEDGRFTFAGQGRYFGAGQGRGGNAGTGSAAAVGRQAQREQSKRADEDGISDRSHLRPDYPGNYSVFIVERGDTLSDIAQRRKGLTARDLAWLNQHPIDQPLRIGQRIKVPTQAYLNAGREARAKFLALSNYIDVHDGKLPPDVANPPSLQSQILDSNWRRERKMDMISISTSSRGHGKSLAGCRWGRWHSGREAIRRRPASPIGSALTMAAISSLLASMAPATASTISPRMPVSTGVPTAPWKTNGPELYKLEARFSSTSSRIVKARRDAPTASTSSGSSMDTKKFKTSPIKRKVKTVAKDKLDLLGPIMSDIGRELAEIVGGDPNGVFLYAEIGDGWDSPNVFKDEGDVVRWYDPSFELSKLLWEAWYAESPSKDKNMNWSVMEYEVKDGKFSARFKYPDEVDVENMDEDRREVALRARYGDRPVVYPPIPDGAFELKP